MKILGALRIAQLSILAHLRTSDELDRPFHSTEVPVFGNFTIGNPRKLVTFFRKKY